MTNRRLLPLLPYLLATATVTLGVALAPHAHADDTGAMCTTDADCAALGYWGQELGNGVDEVMIRTYSDRYLVAEDTTDDGSNPDPVAQCLFAQGYRGLPDDGAEAIYAPAATIEGCAAVSK